MNCFVLLLFGGNDIGNIIVIIKHFIIDALFILSLLLARMMSMLYFYVPFVHIMMSMLYFYVPFVHILYEFKCLCCNYWRSLRFVIIENPCASLKIKLHLARLVVFNSNRQRTSENERLKRPPSDHQTWRRKKFPVTKFKAHLRRPPLAKFFSHKHIFNH